MLIDDVWKLTGACVIAIASVAWVPMAIAHGEHGADAHMAVEYLDCQNPPKNLIGELPEPLSRWARIECAPRGQRIVAGQGKLWRYPGSWFDRPLIPAWGPDESGSIPGAKYFIRLELQPVAAAEVTAMHQRLAKSVVTYADAFTSPPQTMYRLFAENNLGHEMEVYFSERAPDDLWAIMCTPNCRPDYAFMMQAQPK